MKTTSHMVEKEIDDRAVLVSLVTQKDEKNELLAEYSLQELVKLAETAGVLVLETMTQNKETKDTKWFIGKGKVEELKLRLEELGGNTAIFDQELSGAQVRNLEAALDVKIIDRTQLILDIFAQRAKTREGIIQVELAQLSYLLPRLSGQGKNLSRLGGGIGTRGPGESKLETDRRHIRGRIDELKAQLEEVVRHRTLHRERRKKSGVFQVALVGYTNAGEIDVIEATDASGRLCRGPTLCNFGPDITQHDIAKWQKEIVITDTVGFIQNLPHDLVAAFRATLEEANEADLILHVVDSGADMRNEQMRVVAEVLEQLGAHQKEQITVFNKIDLISQEERDLLSDKGEFMKLSAYSSEDLERLRITIENKLMGDSKEFRIPADKGDVIALMYRIGEVLETDVDGEDMVFKVRVNKDDYVKLAYLLAAYDQSQVESEQDENEGESN